MILGLSSLSSSWVYFPTRTKPAIPPLPLFDPDPSSRSLMCCSWHQTSCSWPGFKPSYRSGDNRHFQKKKKKKKSHLRRRERRPSVSNLQTDSLQTGVLHKYAAPVKVELLRDSFVRDGNKQRRLALDISKSNPLQAKQGHLAWDL